jgi:hypothetical protein
MLAISRSRLNREYVLMNVLKALASIISMCNLHVIFISKITPRYFAIYKWNVFPIQCEARLRRSTTTREVDPPSLILIYFYIPALTPCLY